MFHTYEATFIEWLTFFQVSWGGVTGRHYKYTIYTKQLRLLDGRALPWLGCFVIKA